MGSFAWMCNCGCGLEVSPQYDTYEGECHSCNKRLQDGGEAIAYMPDGNHIIDTYDDYGEIGGVDLYAWQARANFPEKCESMEGQDLEKDPAGFWEATRNTDSEFSEERIFAIEAFLTDKYRNKLTGEVYQNYTRLPEEHRQNISREDFYKIYTSFNEVPEWEIKIAFTNCAGTEGDYKMKAASDKAPNQGFGNAVTADCCGNMVCLDCLNSCSQCDDGW
jgi:hypothetical protein